jgi:hypothetical protein
MHIAHVAFTPAVLDFGAVRPGTARRTSETSALPSARCDCAQNCAVDVPGDEEGYDQIRLMSASPIAAGDVPFSHSMASEKQGKPSIVRSF